MSQSTNLQLPYLAANQAQKHVTVNEALRLLDAAVQLTVQDAALGAPPGSPMDGQAWIVAGPASGAWAGWEDEIAYWVDGAWQRLSPHPGWRAFNVADGHLWLLEASGWRPVQLLPPALAELQHAARLGLGMAATGGSPFAAKLNAALWTALYAADGGSGDLITTLNKEAAGGDLGLVLQTGFATRALIGLFGSDKLRLAVSVDGSTFLDGLITDNATGVVDQPNLPRFKGYTNFDNYVAVDTWTKIAINTAEYNEQGAFDAATARFTAPVAGTYLFGASLLFKVNSSTDARMRGRLVLNGSTEIRGSFGEVSGSHVSASTALWLQTLAVLDAGDTVELQGTFRAQDGYFAANHTTFWGARIG
jgi:hypothetical protein